MKINKQSEYSNALRFFFCLFVSLCVEFHIRYDLSALIISQNWAYFRLKFCKRFRNELDFSEGIMTSESSQWDKEICQKWKMFQIKNSVVSLKERFDEISLWCYLCHHRTISQTQTDKDSNFCIKTCTLMPNISMTKKKKKRPRASTILNLSMLIKSYILRRYHWLIGINRWQKNVEYFFCGHFSLSAYLFIMDYSLANFTFTLKMGLFISFYWHPTDIVWQSLF